jgi:hypothetical protein
MTSMTPLDFDLKALFTADHADNVNGKLYINGGGWNRLFFPGFPQVLPAMAVVALVEVPFGRYHAEHTFSVGLIDPDGASLPARVDGKFRVGAAADLEYGEPTLMPLAIAIQNVILPRAGHYSITFTIDGVELGRYSIKAVHVNVPLQFNITPPAPPDAEAS